MLHVVNANFGRKRVGLSDVGIAACHPWHLTASCRFRMPMICSSVNRPFFISESPFVASSYRADLKILNFNSIGPSPGIPGLATLVDLVFVGAVGEIGCERYIDFDRLCSYFPGPEISVLFPFFPEFVGKLL